MASASSTADTLAVHADSRNRRLFAAQVDMTAPAAEFRFRPNEAGTEANVAFVRDTITRYLSQVAAVFRVVAYEGALADLAFPDTCSIAEKTRCFVVITIGTKAELTVYREPNIRVVTTVDANTAWRFPGGCQASTIMIATAGETPPDARVVVLAYTRTGRPVRQTGELLAVIKTRVAAAKGAGANGTAHPRGELVTVPVGTRLGAPPYYGGAIPRVMPDVGYRVISLVRAVTVDISKYDNMAPLVALLIELAQPFVERFAEMRTAASLGRACTHNRDFKSDEADTVGPMLEVLGEALIEDLCNVPGGAPELVARALSASICRRSASVHIPYGNSNRSVKSIVDILDFELYARFRLLDVYPDNVLSEDELDPFSYLRDALGACEPYEAYADSVQGARTRLFIHANSVSDRSFVRMWTVLGVMDMLAAWLFVSVSGEVARNQAVVLFITHMTQSAYWEPIRDSVADALGGGPSSPGGAFAVTTAALITYTEQALVGMTTLPPGTTRSSSVSRSAFDDSDDEARAPPPPGAKLRRSTSAPAQPIKAVQGRKRKKSAAPTAASPSSSSLLGAPPRALGGKGMTTGGKGLFYMSGKGMTHLDLGEYSANGTPAGGSDAESDGQGGEDDQQPEGDGASDDDATSSHGGSSPVRKRQRDGPLADDRLPATS